jgi:hypothetical protein
MKHRISVRPEAQIEIKKTACGTKADFEAWEVGLGMSFAPRWAISLTIRYPPVN